MFIKDLIADCGITLKAIQAELLTVFDANMSKATISNYLKGMKMSLKNINLIAMRLISPKNAMTRMDYCYAFLEIVDFGKNYAYFNEVG